MSRRFLSFLLVLLLLPFAGLAEAPAGAPSASIEDAVAQFLQEDFQKQASQAEDAWERYIYEHGVAEIDMNLEKFDVEKGKPLSVSFLVAGGQPKVKTQPKYEGDPAAWLKGIVDAMAIQDASVKVNLAITAADGGFAAEYAAKAEASLQKAVKAIATKARKALVDKTILAAITDYLMPTPIATPKKAPAALNEADYQAAFKDYVSRNGLNLESHPIIPALLYGLKGYKLDVSGGPESFALTYTAPNLIDLLDAASQTLGRDLCYDANAKQYDTATNAASLAKETEKGVISFRHGKKADETLSYTFSLLALPENLSPQKFYIHMDTSADSAFSEALMYVQARILLMPDYPAVPTPKTGLVSGESSGTKCTLKAYEDGYSRFVSFYNATTDELYSSAFVGSGSSVTIRIPKGIYYYTLAIGDVWYGPEHLFGDLGAYLKSDNIEIPSTRYIYTLTFNPKREGNINMTQY